MTNLLNKIRESEREFEEKFPHGIYMVRSFGMEDFEAVDDQLKSFHRTNLISIFEENLVRLRGMIKSDKGAVQITFVDGTYAEQEVESNMVIGYNSAINAEIAYWEGIIKELTKK